MIANIVEKIDTAKTFEQLISKKTINKIVCNVNDVLNKEADNAILEQTGIQIDDILIEIEDEVSVYVNASCDFRHHYSEGDYWTPKSHSTKKIYTTVNTIEVYQEGSLIELSANQIKVLRNLINNEL